MSNPLLSTKLYLPRPRRELVPRSRLLQQLDGGLARKLILISAPPGFGKTTLLAVWIERNRLPAGWLSLDAGDNDPARFTTYLAAALQSVNSRLGQATLAMLHSPQPPPLETILTTLLNEAAQMSENFILVLDDYHLITAQPIHSAVTFLLDHLPPPLHLVIISRADPPLPLSRMRVRHQLTELRSADLRFTTEEATLFFYQTGLELPGPEAAALVARTEGWAAGLQLAALSLQGQAQPGIHHFITTFTGDNRYILDYLGEEVLQHQPVPVQRFLRQTSILDRLTGPLCDAILDWGLEAPVELPAANFQARPEGSSVSSQEILEYLERANLFLVPMDDQRRWYRYHHLFADFLREQLERSCSGLDGQALIAELHRRASAWHEQHGLPAEAVKHALRAGDLSRAGELVEQAGQELLMRGEMTTFLSWVEALPETLVRSRPQLCVFQAWALIFNGQIAEAEQRLADASQKEAGPAILSQVAAIRAFTTAMQGDVYQAAALARQALADLPAEALFLRGITAISSAIIDIFAGDVAVAHQTFGEIARIGRESGNVFLAALATAQIAELHLMGGRLREAAQIYEQALALANTPEGQPLPGAGMVHAGLALLAYHWNNLEKAEYHATQSLTLSQQLGEAGAFDSYVILARLRLAQGDTAAALEALAQGQPFIQHFSVMGNLLLDVLRVRAWLVEGNLAAAEDWAQTYQCHPGIYGLTPVPGDDQEPELTPYYPYEIGQLCLARVLLARSRHDTNPTPAQEARQLLERLSWRAGRLGRTSVVLEVLLLQALACQAEGDSDRALSYLNQALEIPETEGFVRLFLDEGPPLAQLLLAARRQSEIRRPYLDQLLAAFGAETIENRLGGPELSPERPGSPALSLPENLSERELEVLRLIAAGRSNREIGESLILAPGTVKKYVNNIYGKLGVHSRTQALAIARSLGLLDA